MLGYYIEFISYIFINTKFWQYKLVGSGDEKKADQVAIDAMRAVLNSMEISGTIAIGEDERDEADIPWVSTAIWRFVPEIFLPAFSFHSEKFYEICNRNE